MVKRYVDGFEMRVFPFPDEHHAGIQHILATKADTEGQINQWARSVLMPGCAVPLHDHETTQEVFVMVSGYALYNDNGVETVVGPGDVMYIPCGSKHAIANPYKEPAVVFELNMPATPVADPKGGAAGPMGRV